MDEVDIENADDLNELEARLYAQLHHEPSGDCDVTATYKEASPVRQVTATSVINNKSIDRTRGRYWNEKSNVRNAAPTKQNPVTIELVQLDKEKPIVSAGSGELIEKPVETADKTFPPPVKKLSNLRVNPFASGNDPKTKGSSTNLRNKNSAADKSKKIEMRETNKGPFARQQNKLAHAMKYEGKKQKAKAAKAKMIKTKLTDGTIQILSESDTDDIIEVKVPSPKIVTIDTSSDEENVQEKQMSESFVKPEAIATRENTSRCTSPCSVISDDFIGQHDRSRLLEESQGPDDKDLLMLQVDVDSLMEPPEKSMENASDSNTLNISSIYRVTETNFRALDVYESESDIQESIYAKGIKKAKPSLVVNLEHESSSGDDVEEIDITQKTKRLRKRRASSANKDSETLIDSTDSEQENESGVKKIREKANSTNIPHIAYGEALENMVTEVEILKQATVNTSDNEFIASLNTLAQGDTSSAAAAVQNDSDEEEETITARAIAENVLRKHSTAETTTTADAVIEEPEVSHNDDANEAVPNDSLAELDNIFSSIDNMDKRAAGFVDDSDESDSSVQLVAPLPVSTRNKSSYQSKLKMLKETGDPVYNVIYSENLKVAGGGGIGWNEEMRRFYNDSWKGERFSVKAVCAQMKPIKTLWKIYTDDRYPKYRKHSNQKCMNCCEFGHIRSRCPRPRKPPVCYMCGERGHQEPRCPNTVCLRCGNKTRMFTKSCNSCNYQNRLICPICKVRGHSINLCPDKWRRYHSTTKPNEYPNDKIEYKKRKLCCICGFRGHLSEHCRNAVYFSEYPMFISEIKSHQKSYDDISIRTIRSGIGFNLMYKPEEDVSFELAENKTKRQYYGRFLLAVGMGHLLTRKRKVDEKEGGEPSEKQKKSNTKLKEYVVNPFAKVALEKSPAKPSSNENSVVVNEQQTETVVLDEQPVDLTEQINAEAEESILQDNVSTSEPINIDEDDAYAIEPSTSKGIDQTSSKKNSSTSSAFKTPETTSAGVPSRKNQEAVDLVDSDSNYSFSEHFETNQQQGNQKKAREMDPLPDFIPIVDDEDEDEEETEELINTGISKKFVSVETDEEEENTNNELPDLPCDAKIYLTTFHSKFLLSPEGNKFLMEKSKSIDVKARLEWTSVGHILIIYGLRRNQDKFHIELLHKFRELSEKMNRNQLEKSQKVPRKTEVLIRFLRENLNQLLTNLGNPNELFKRLTYQEKQQTKTGWKSAEKTRRQLNMILIGQAGLCNGSKHLDHLLSHLRNLIDDCKDEVVSNDVRDEIDLNWKLIFSSHRHEKYSELVNAYNHMQFKNRFLNINIDPRLLGKKVVDTSFTKAQKDKMDTSGNTLNISFGAEKLSTPMKLVPNPLATKTPPNRPPKTPVSEKKRPKNVPSYSSPAAQKSFNHQKQSKIANQEINDSTVASQIKAVNAGWAMKCNNLLTEIDDTGKLQKPGGPIQNAKANSTFWSREALKYIDECMDLGRSNVGFLEKLSRVQIKSQKGLLSYNDYRAIIKIHNAIKGKQ